MANSGMDETGIDTFDSDDLWNYELGVKSTLADSRVQLNASVYHIDWSDIQTRIDLAGFDPAGPCSSILFLNLGKADVDGVEVSLTAQVTEGLQLSANLGYVDSRTSGANTLLVPEVPDGADIPGVSDFTASVSGDYSFDVLERPVFFRVDYAYLSESDSSIYGSDDPTNVELNGFGIVNLNLNVELADNLNVSFFGKNLADKRGVVGTGALALLGDDVFLMRPREFGLKATYSF